MTACTHPITLVALTGLAGSGKDTVADTLVQHHGFVKLAFADSLRAEVAVAFDIAPAYLTVRETKEHPISALAVDKCIDPAFVSCVEHLLARAGLSPQLLAAPRSPRQILQWWGTEYRRVQHPDYWVKKVHNKITTPTSCGRDRFVISDCRFENEAALVRHFGGSIWQVVRPGITPAQGSHISETEGNQFLPHVLLGNTGDIRHLQLQALAACNRILPAAQAA